MIHGKTRKPQSAGSIGASAALVLSGAVIGLLLCELILYQYYVRLRGDMLEVALVPAFESPLVYTRRPNQDVKVADKMNHVNNAGFRRVEDTPDTRLPDTVRILSYGDSIGHGFGVADGEQYTDQLELVLNRTRRTPRWEVLSTFRGSSPGIYAFHVRVDQPRFQPDWVMMEIELQNDLTDEALLVLGPSDETGLPQTVHGGRYVVSLEGVVINNLSSTVPFVSRTLVYSNIVSVWGMMQSRLARNPLFLPGASPYYYNVGSDQYLLTQTRLDQAFDRMFESIRAIQRFVESNRARFLLILVAGRDAFEEGAAADAPRRLFQRAVERSSEFGIPHVNTYPHLKEAGGRDLFLDFCHPNRRGHRVIADALYAFFSNQTTASVMPAPERPPLIDPPPSELHTKQSS